MPPPAAPAAAVAAAFATDPGRPVLTFRDGATGERTELSARTLGTWVAKTANLLVEEYDAGSGTRVAVALPLHWQGHVWLLACWAVGATVVLGPGPVDLLVSSSPGGTDRAGERVALALRPLAVPGAAPPVGWFDYDREVRAYGDAFAGPPVVPGAPALDDGERVLDGAGLLAAALVVAHRQGLTAADRVLTTDAPDHVDALVADLATLVAGASLVLARNPVDGSGVSVLDPGAWGQEQVTAVRAGLQGTSGAADLPGVRLLPR